MSSREPMWYCHECHAEMRPLMVPDPICASCRGSFVEKIENPSNDPRDFANSGVPADVGGDGGLDHFFMGLQTLLNRGMQPNPQRNTDEPLGQRSQSRVTFQIRNAGPRGTSFTFGTSSPSPNPGSPPTMSEFLRSAPPSSNNGDNRDNPQISGPLFAQYLISLLGQTDHPLLPMVGGMPESGRMGDYVFSQEALDQIITQIMESSNANRPVPATEEIVQKLPREVLTEGSHFLSADCAVCKDQFQLGTEDPDEQIVVTLPCKHPFHSPCILPWLKSSGTCPVCRHALVPQPDQNASINNQPSMSASSSTSPFNASSSQSIRVEPQSSPGRRTRSGGSADPYRSGTGAGLFTQLFRNLSSPVHDRDESSLNSAHSSTSPASPTPTSPPFGSASGPRDPTRRHTHRSSMDSSAPFDPRPSSQTQSRSPPPHLPSGFRFGSSQSQRDRQRNQHQNSDGGGGRGGGSQSGRPHVPGEWSDDLMDLD